MSGFFWPKTPKYCLNLYCIMLYNIMLNCEKYNISYQPVFLYKQMIKWQVTNPITFSKTTYDDVLTNYVIINYRLSRPVVSIIDNWSSFADSCIHNRAYFSNSIINNCVFLHDSVIDNRSGLWNDISIDFKQFPIPVVPE